MKIIPVDDSLGKDKKQLLKQEEDLSKRLKEKERKTISEIGTDFNGTRSKSNKEAEEEIV